MSVKLLFVDDEPKLQAVIRQLLRQEIRHGEYHVLFVETGAAALQTLQTEPDIDIVFTDLNMPGLNGLLLLAKIQEMRNQLNPVLTPIVISAYDDMENIRKAMNAGAFDFLTKPLNFEDVRLTIAKAIAHVSRLRQAYRQEAQAKEALRQMNRELERRVQERTSELQKSNAELNAFAHTMAHDIKNPLSIINGYIDYAVDFFQEIEPAELYETLVNIRQFTYKSINIVDELLLLAGVRKYNAPRMPVDMAVLVKNAQNRLRVMIEQYHGNILTPESWPVVNGYSPWIEEVWVNYISNGLKYGGQPPRLQLGADPAIDGIVRFWVLDNGAGLSTENQQRLFTEFTRLDETRGDGHGLGLSIVRRIMERLDGQVGVESQPGHGSKFYFTLPAA